YKYFYNLNKLFGFQLLNVVVVFYASVNFVSVMLVTPLSSMVASVENDDFLVLLSLAENSCQRKFENICKTVHTDCLHHSQLDSSLVKANHRENKQYCLR